jgi:hypothetical protein
MIEVYKKRGKWCYRDAKGTLRKFDTKEEALGIDTSAPTKECDFCAEFICSCADKEVEGNIW